MDALSDGGDLELRDSLMVAGLKTDLTIAFQTGQPVSAIATDKFEVLQATVPTVKGDYGRAKPALEP